MKDQRAVRRYAAALFLLAETRNELDIVDRDFLAVRKLIEQHPEISHLVLNSTISHAEKEDFIDKIVPSEISRTLENFIKVLVKKRRFMEIFEIQDEFHRMSERKKRIQKVEAVSARPLSQANEAKLKEVLKRKLKSEIRLISSTDPDLIGGLILRFDGKEINASYKNRLNELKQILIMG